MNAKLEYINSKLAEMLEKSRKGDRTNFEASAQELTSEVEELVSSGEISPELREEYRVSLNRLKSSFLVLLPYKEVFFFPVSEFIRRGLENLEEDEEL
jgi:hypothetical protein